MKKISLAKRMLSLLLTLSLLATTLLVGGVTTSAETVSTYTGGNGEALREDAEDANVLYIDTAAQLKYLSEQILATENAKNYLGKTIKLTTDIVWNEGNASDWTETTTGLYSWDGGDWKYAFYGTFDGQGHTISGLYGVGSKKNDYVEFLMLGNNAVVKNVSIVNSYFSAASGFTGYNVGVFSSQASTATVENVYSDAIVKNLYGSNAGGIVGYNHTGTLTVRNCVFEGTVTVESQNAGGIVGGSRGPVVVENCLNLGTVAGTGSAALGGIVGSAWGATVTVQKCINLGSVSGSTKSGAIYGTSTSAEKTVSGNLYDSTKVISGDGTTVDGNTAMTVDAIKAMDNVALVSAGLTQWVAAKKDGAKLPVPAAAVELMGAEVETPVTADAVITAVLVGKDATVQLLGQSVNTSKASSGLAVSFSVTGLAVGTHEFTLKITDTDAGGWTYDRTVKTVTVTVDGEGNVVYQGNNPTFTNTYNASTPQVKPAADASVFDGKVSTKLRNDGRTIYIDSAADLAFFAQRVSSGFNYGKMTVVLTTDIIWNKGDASTWSDSTADLYDWVCGKWGYVFSGTFDGQGHVISGLWSVTSAAEDGKNVGFISVAKGAVIKNLVITNSYFGGKANVGSLVGISAGGDLTVQSVYSDAYVSPSGGNVGGFVGAVHVGGLKTTIENSVFAGSVKGNTSVGGFIGVISKNANDTKESETVIKNSINMGAVNGSGSTAGFIGTLQGGTVSVETSVNAGVVTCSDAETTGALLGNSAAVATFKDCVYVKGTAEKATGANLKDGVSVVTKDAVWGAKAKTTLRKFDFEKVWITVEEGYPLPLSVYTSIFGEDGKVNPPTSDFVPVTFILVGLLALTGAVVILRKKKTH